MGRTLDEIAALLSPKITADDDDALTLVRALLTSWEETHAELAAVKEERDHLRAHIERNKVSAKAAIAADDVAAARIASSRRHGPDKL